MPRFSFKTYIDAFTKLFKSILKNSGNSMNTKKKQIVRRLYGEKKDFIEVNWK